MAYERDSLESQVDAVLGERKRERRGERDTNNAPLVSQAIVIPTSAALLAGWRRSFLASFSQSLANLLHSKLRRPGLYIVHHLRRRAD